MQALKITLAALSTAAVAVVGVAVGAAVADPEPEVRTETVTHTETVEVTTDECLSLVEDGEALIDLLIESSDLAAAGFDAVARGDYLELELLTLDVEDLGDRALGVIEEYYANADACAFDNADLGVGA